MRTFVSNHYDSCSYFDSAEGADANSHAHAHLIVNLLLLLLFFFFQKATTMKYSCRVKKIREILFYIKHRVKTTASERRKEQKKNAVLPRPAQPDAGPAQENTKAK